MGCNLNINNTLHYKILKAHVKHTIKTFFSNVIRCSKLKLSVCCFIYFESYICVIFRSSLIYNTSARHEQHECNTCNTTTTRVQHQQHECNKSETQATRTQHKCNTSATLTTRVQHECYTNDKSATRVKNFDFDDDTSKRIF